jgi:hypothetical protein
MPLVWLGMARLDEALFDAVLVVSKECEPVRLRSSVAQEQSDNSLATPGG